MPQVKPLPEEIIDSSRSRLVFEEKQELDEIVRVIRENFSRELDEIMASQERRRRSRK